MLFVRIRRAVVIGGAIVMLLGLVVNPAVSGPAHHAARMGVAPVTAMLPVTAMAPVAAPTCCVTPAPYHANRIMWTPGYGISSTCNPLAARSCGYGVTACMAPTPVAPVAAACAPCGTYAAAAPVATTTFRPFWSRLFCPTAPLVPTTTYRVAFCAPAAPCPTACAPMAGCPTTACLPVASGCPTAPCDPCGGVGGYGMPSSNCPSGACAPAVTETPTPVPSLPSASYEPAPSAGAPTSSYDPTAALGSPTSTYEAAPALGAPTPADAGSVVPRTFKDETQPSTQPDIRLRPTPAPETKSDDSNTGTGAPRLIDPVAQTTARPIRPASYTVPVTRAAPVQPPAKKRSVDVSGWRAARD